MRARSTFQPFLTNYSTVRLPNASLCTLSHHICTERISAQVVSSPISTFLPIPSIDVPPSKGASRHVTRPRPAPLGLLFSRASHRPQTAPRG